MAPDHRAVEDPEDDRDESPSFFDVELLPLVRRHTRGVLTFAGIAAVLVAVVMGMYNWIPSARWIARVGFRPRFEGAESNKYPNGLPFNPSDIVDRTVVDQVYDQNHFDAYCDRTSFASGLFVQSTSTAARFLELDYTARLADSRLTQVQRDQIAAEYRSKRDALTPEYELAFVRPAACRPIPQTLIFKGLSDVLTTWAHDADVKRNVMKMRVAVLSPAALASAIDPSTSQLIRAEAVRGTLNRAVLNVNGILQLPGAELVRYGKEDLSFVELRGQMEDLVSLRLQPMLLLAGRNLGEDSGPWVREVLAAAKIRAQRSQAAAQSLTSALAAYTSGAALPTSGPTPQRSSSGADVQAFTTQIDQGFIDRIVGLSAENTKFRQKMTDDVVLAAQRAAADQSDVDYYSQLLTSVQSPGTISVAEVDRRLQRIIERGKELLTQLDQLYGEFSRVSLRSGQLYEFTDPATVELARPYTLRQYGTVVAGTFGVVLILGFVGAFVEDRLRA